MKKFNDLTKKELRVWEQYIKEIMEIKTHVPVNLLRRCWEDRYEKERHIYNPIFNTKPSKEPKKLEPIEEHRTYVEDVTKVYDLCV